MADCRTKADFAGERVRGAIARAKKLEDTRAAERRDVIKHLEDYDIREDISCNSEAWGSSGMPDEIRDAIEGYFNNAIERIVESVKTGAHEGLADG